MVRMVKALLRVLFGTQRRDDPHRGRIAFGGVVGITYEKSDPEAAPESSNYSLGDPAA